MKRVLISVASVLLVATVATAQPAPGCELDGQRVDPANARRLAGKTGLVRCFGADTNQVISEQELHNGKFVGVVRHFEKGRLLQEQHVNARGELHGRAREFDENSQVVRESQHENGREVGLALSYHRNGQLRSAVYFSQGGAELARADLNDAGQFEGLHCADKPVLAPAVNDARRCGFSGGESVVELFTSTGQRSGRVTYDRGRKLREEFLGAASKP